MSNNINSAQRELASGGLQQFMDHWWSKRNIDLHTMIPAKVLEVNYVKNSVTVQPLIKTYVNHDIAIPFPQCIDVPVSLISNGLGGAKITIPIKSGAVGLLKFSERDTTNWVNSIGTGIVDPDIKENLSMGSKLYPISFEVGLFTPSSAIEWDSENIVIQHGDHSIKLPLLPSDPILINGVSITASGNVVTSAGTDLDQLKADFDTLNTDFGLHVHTGNQGADTSTWKAPD
jgi:hypothetical protein